MLGQVIALGLLAAWLVGGHAWPLYAAYRTTPSDRTAIEEALKAADRHLVSIERSGQAIHWSRGWLSAYRRYRVWVQMRDHSEAPIWIDVGVFLQEVYEYDPEPDARRALVP